MNAQVINTQFAESYEATQTMDIGDQYSQAATTNQDSLDILLNNSKNYVVVLSSGNGDAGKRATLALSAACTAQAMELDTQLFLIGDGAHWAYRENTQGIHQPGFPVLDDLIESFVEMQGGIYLCSACDAVCTVAVQADAQPLVRHSTIQTRGLASILEHMIGGSSITF